MADSFQILQNEVAKIVPDYEVERHIRSVKSRLAENAALVIVRAGDDKIEWASESLERMFGYGRKGELRGQLLDSLLPSAKRAHHKAHRLLYDEAPQTRMMGERFNDLLGRKKDGTLFPVRINLDAITSEDGVQLDFAEVFDVTPPGTVHLLQKE